MPNARNPYLAVLVAALLLVQAMSQPALAELIYGVTPQQFLITWDSSNPMNLVNGVAIQGLQLNESILGIDVRPATGQLYALGSTSRLYTINPFNGQATPVGGPGPFSPPVNGANFGMDFNPTVDRLRVVSNTDQNLRLNPTTGLVTNEDFLLEYALGDPNEGAAANVISAAYTNNFPGATSTTLYGIDTGLDILVIQNPPNDGTLITVGDLGIDATDVGGFDISGLTGNAYAVLFDTALGRSIFAAIDLDTGAASAVGEINGGTTVTAMTVVPEPAGLLLVAVGLLPALRRRTRP